MGRVGTLGVDKVFTLITPEHGTSSASVTLADRETIHLLWPTMLSILEQRGSVALGVFSEMEIFKLLSTGILDAWCGIRGSVLEGFALCGWEVHDRAKYYHVIQILGSNLDLYMREGLEKIEKYAMIMGAVEVVIEGRKGWQRKLAKQGYAPRTVRLRKNVRKAWGN